MLTFLLITAMFGRGQSLVSYGFEFITAFPENVAYFYPVDPQNSLNFTALYNDTEIDVYFNGELTYTTILEEGQTKNYALPENVEEEKFTQSLKTVRVVSSKYIVALSISKQGDSIQTNVLHPYKNLGTFYSIPYLNYSEILSTFYQTSEIISKRYKFFRLVIINAEDVENNITIIRKSFQNEKVVLKPWALFQLQLNNSEIAVDALYKVAVIVAHPCLDASECKCSMVVNQLHPNAQWGQSFVVPSLNNMSYLHVTDSAILGGASNLELVKSTKYINTNYPASLRLISPGLIVEVIPESMFSACYLVHFSLKNESVLLIAETVIKSYVHIDSGLLPVIQWTTIAGTIYSFASVPLNGRHVIWHPTSKIGVYMFRKMASGTQYGGPAVPLSDKPDPAGCLFYSSEYQVIPTPMTWPESHQYCMSVNGVLVNPTTTEAQGALADIFKDTPNHNQMWIGLRRSLLTLEWNWHMGENLADMNSTQWSPGEPGDPVMGMCASILPNLTWKIVPCCAQLKAICYKKPNYFPVDVSY